MGGALMLQSAVVLCAKAGGRFTGSLSYLLACAGLPFDLHLPCHLSDLPPPTHPHTCCRPSSRPSAPTGLCAWRCGSAWAPTRSAASSSPAWAPSPPLCASGEPG